MSESVAVAVPRKGRPLEAALERLAAVGGEAAARLTDEVSTTLRYEKAVTKDEATAERGVYERLAAYSDTTVGAATDTSVVADSESNGDGNEIRGPEYTLVRDDRDGHPRRIVFDSATLVVDDISVRLVGREEPFRALRTHEFALGFDSADLVLEEVVTLSPTGVERIADVNERIDPRDTDVRVATGLGDTVYHTLLATPAEIPPGTSLDRSFVADYAGDLCISPRYERLVEAVLGTDALSDVTFCYPAAGREEEAAIADAGVGVYLTVTGNTAREHGLVVGEKLFPSETVLLENEVETTAASERVRAALADGVETAIETAPS